MQWISLLMKPYQVLFMFCALVGTISTQNTDSSSDPSYADGYPDPSIDLTDQSQSQEQEQETVSALKTKELPIINPRRLNPNLLMVCDDLLSPDDVYTSLMTVLARVEDAFRRNNCDTQTFQISQVPVVVHTLLGRLRSIPLSKIKEHPFIGSFVETLMTRTKKLLAKAESCQLDYVLLTKIIRMSMKFLVNRINCGYVEGDMVKNQYGLPSGYGSYLPPLGPGLWPRRRGLSLPFPFTKYGSMRYFDPRYPYWRWPNLQSPIDPWGRVPRLARAIQPLASKTWPYYVPDSTGEVMP